jgi:NTE family protein
LDDFLNLALSSARAENAKIAFACPAYHMGKQQIYMMNRGSFTQLLPFCLSFPPLFKPYQENIAGVLDLKTAVDYLRAHGATYVVYVDLLSGPLRMASANVESQILWSLSAEALSKQEKGLDYVIHVPLQDYDLLDFNHRREMIQKGQQAGQDAANILIKKLGL